MRLTATRSSITSGGGAVLDPITQEDPSLDLNFAYSKALRDDVDSNNPITFTRQSAGTYVGSDGLIKTTPVNLIEYSEDFSSWSAINANASLTPNAATAPDGTLTATSLYAAAAPAFIGDGTSFTVGKFYTFSCYFKAGSGNLVSIFLYSTNATAGYWDNSNINVARAFNLTTGTSFAFGGGTVDPSSWSIEPAGDGWYRCSITSQSTGATSGSNQLIRSLTAPDRDILAWGYQVEEGSAPTDYIPTNGAISGAPRFDHDPYTRESLGLLVEKARTNFVTNSEKVDTWSQQRVSTTANAETAPDGNLTADLVTEDTQSTGHYTARPISQWTAGKIYTTSIFAKENPNNPNKRYFSIVGVAGTFGVTVGASFDLTGEGSYSLINAGTNVSAAITRLTNGWYRCSFTAEPTSSTTSSVQFRFSDHPTIVVKNYTGDNQSGFYLWGAQVEEGAFSSSYISTDGATVTRAGDVIEIAGDKLNYKNYVDKSGRLDLWGRASGFAIPNYSVAPDGTKTGALIRATNGGGVFDAVSTSGIRYASAYFRNITGSVRFGQSSGGTNARVIFDSNFNIVSQDAGVVSVSFEAVANGWTRVSIKTSVDIVSLTIYGQSPGHEFEVWGPQLEEGPVVTNYTPSVESFVSRASSATYVDDATGLIKTSAVNMLRYSQDFSNAFWLKNGFGTGSAPVVTSNYGTAPDGSNTADRIQFNKGAGTTAGDQSTFAASSITTVVGQPYTASVYMRTLDGSTKYVRLTFNGLTGSGDTLATVTGEWKRFIISINSATDTSRRLKINLRGTFGTSDDADLLVWGAQQEDGTEASDYVPTTSIASSAPRYENGKLLLERAATNLVPYSEAIASWAQLRVTTTSNVATAPDGTQTADLVTEDTTDGGHYVSKAITAFTAGKLYTTSGYVKINPNNPGKRFITIVGLAATYGANIAAMFDLTDEGSYALLPFGTNVSATIERKANGWYRISMTAEATASVASGMQFRLTTTMFPPTEFYPGDGESGFYLWGAQVEEGAFATSYIHTPDLAAVTRAADVYTSTLGDSGFYNQDKGTVFVSYNKPWSGNWPNYGAFFRVEDTATPTADFINWGGTNGTNTQVYWTAEVGNVSQLPYASYNAPGPGKFSHAVAVASNDAAFAAGGSIRGTDTVVNLPTVNRGVIAATDTQISRIAYFPERLSNDKLNELTK